MLFSSQPALRHFAVLSLEKRRRYGTIWLVKDRRGLGENQCLLVPSKAKAWPLLLSALTQLDASPVRLRNGKVALLVGSNDLRSIHESITRSKKTNAQTLNAFSGFESAASISKRKPLLAILVMAAIVAFVSVVPKSAQTHS